MRRAGAPADERDAVGVDRRQRLEHVDPAAQSNDRGRRVVELLRERRLPSGRIGRRLVGREREHKRYGAARGHPGRLHHHLLPVAAGAVGVDDRRVATLGRRHDQEAAHAVSFRVCVRDVVHGDRVFGVHGPGVAELQRSRSVVRKQRRRRCLRRGFIAAAPGRDEDQRAEDERDPTAWSNRLFRSSASIRVGKTARDPACCAG